MTASGPEHSGPATLPAYRRLAHAMSERGVPMVFTLMGDANMHLITALARDGVRVIHVRHEHSAVVMAEGRSRHTGKVGVASVTCGPGLPQTSTALTAASRRGERLLLLAGDVPDEAIDHNMRFHHRPFVESIGAHFLDGSAEPVAAFHRAYDVADHRRGPVVLRLPSDVLLKAEVAGPEVHHAVPPPEGKPARPVDPDTIEQLLTLLRQARRPLLLAGRGAVDVACEGYVAALADSTGLPSGRPWRRWDRSTAILATSELRAGSPAVRRETCSQSQTWSSWSEQA